MLRDRWKLLDADRRNPPSHVIDDGTRAPLNLSELHFAGEREACVVGVGDWLSISEAANNEIHNGTRETLQKRRDDFIYESLLLAHESRW